MLILNDRKDALGGGPSFARQLAEHIEQKDDGIVFIPAATMIEKETFKRNLDKKIVLRIDNYLKHSRNRGAGMSRMEDIARASTMLVFQSEWSKRYLLPYLRKKGVTADSTVILNGSDTRIFNSRKPIGHAENIKIDDKSLTFDAVKENRRKRYLFVASSTDQSKGWVMAHQKFQELHRQEDCELWLVGKFDRAVREYNFDFFNDERVTYKGIVQRQEEMANIYKQCDSLLYSFFMDCCSNVAIEAKLCGMEIVDCYGMTMTGGMPEIMAAEDLSLERCVLNYKQLFTSLQEEPT